MIDDTLSNYICCSFYSLFNPKAYPSIPLLNLSWLPPLPTNESGLGGAGGWPNLLP